MTTRLLTAVLLLTVAACACAQTPELQVNPDTHETEAQFAARTKWWRDAKFGMFIHWGVYSVPAESVAGYPGEWYYFGYNTAQSKVKPPEMPHYLQMKDYEKFAARFNPVKFDAHRWVQIAKDAGMKYIVITSKHHDGFDMFGTKLNHDWNIVDATPFHRDPLKELADECRKQGIRLCFYHSIMDWHNPDYLPRRPWEKEARPADGASLDRYIEYMKGQIKELLTNYGPIGILWFDGGWEHNAKELHSAEVNAMIRQLQPGILINDRNQEKQDYSTPEQTIPANALPGGRLWETCMTMNNTWGYARNDNNWKSSEDLIHKLCDIASKGGNFLLNVGPTDLGEFPEASVERLGDIGRWMDVNGASIYGTTKSPFHRLPFDGRCTQKGSTLYLQVFQWPSEGLRLDGLQTRVAGARALNNRSGEALRVNRAAGSDTVYISQPKQLDPVATVVELRLAGPVVVSEAAASSAPARPASDGSFDLKAADAEIHGNTAQYEQGGGKDNIGFWTNRADYVTWTVDAPAAGQYKVTAVYACPPENAGSRYTVGVEGGGSLTGLVADTGSWMAFQPKELGTPSLKAGRQTIAVHATDMPHGAVMNLKALRLASAK